MPPGRRACLAIAASSGAKAALVHIVEPMAMAFGGDVPMDLSLLQQQQFDQARERLQSFAGRYPQLGAEQRHLTGLRPAASGAASTGRGTGLRPRSWWAVTAATAWPCCWAPPPTTCCTAPRATFDGGAPEENQGITPGNGPATHSGTSPALMTSRRIFCSWVSIDTVMLDDMEKKVRKALRLKSFADIVNALPPERLVDQLQLLELLDQSLELPSRRGALMRKLKYRRVRYSEMVRRMNSAAGERRVVVPIGRLAQHRRHWSP